MNKTKIEWTDYTWNPIKGICPVGCWYCYARKIYERFNWPTELSWDGRVPILSNKKPSKIFVCSTIEMFHPDIPKEWRDRIFKIIDADYNQKHIFQILTKFPQNIDRDMPDNVWLGVTVTGENKHSDYWKIARFLKYKPKIAFISFEPLLDYQNDWILTLIQHFQWIIIGRLTGYGNKYNPKLTWIKEIVQYCSDYGIKIFLKDNLKDIWEGPLIQEFPE